MSFFFDMLSSLIHYMSLVSNMEEIIKMTNLVYTEDDYPAEQELIGRTLTDEEYECLTVEELITAIRHSSWAWWVFAGTKGLEPNGRFTIETQKWLNEQSARELKEFIREKDGLIIRLDEPEERNEFPVFSKGPRKGFPNYKKEPETCFDRWHDIHFKDECILK